MSTTVAPATPLRILMVTRETAADQRYGIGKSLWPVVHALRTRGHEVRYLSQVDLGARSLRWQRWWHEQCMPRWPTASRRAAVARWLWALAERINMGRLAAQVAAREGYTIVHCHDPLIALGFRLFRPLHAGAWRAHWGVTEHGFGSYAQAMQDDGVPMNRFAMRFLRAMEAGVLVSAAWVMSPTRAALQALARDLAFTECPEHWHVVPHPRPRLQAYRREAPRAELGWSDEVFYVLGIGRLAPLKQFDVLVRACAQCGEGEHLQLVILGDGDRGRLQALARDVGLARPIIFELTEDVSKHLAAADVYVSTSATESFGMANLEALCAGLPSICSPVGGVPEVVRSGAWLVPPTAAAVGEALRRLRCDATLRSNWADIAKRQAEEWPDTDAVAEQYEAIYRHVLAN
jgi:glycosyltransferase involved in cell wall biosynthesis